MALSQQSVVYDVAAAKIYPLISDVVGGGSPTYGAGVSLQGVAAASFDPNVVSQTLKGDNGRTIARHGRTDMFTMSLTYGRVGLDAIAVMMGGSVVDSGTGSTEMQAFTMPGFNTLPFFRLEIQITDLDNGILDFHLIGWKAQIQSATFVDTKTDAFGQPQLSVQCISTSGSFAPYGATTGQQMTSMAFYATQTPLA